MFTIWKKKKPLEVRFFTDRDGLVDLFPPQFLGRDVPDWWKNTPAYVDDTPPPNGMKEDPRLAGRIKPKKLNKSAKHCYSIQETLKRAISFPCWSDAFLQVDHTGRVKHLAPGKAHMHKGKNLGEQHPKKQYPGLLTQEWTNWKWNAAWMAYTEEFVPFYMCDPFYHKVSRDWQTMPGVIEFHYQHNLNVNTILRTPPKAKEGEKQQVIEYEYRAGDHLAYFVPMIHDREIIIKAEQVDDKEWERLHYGHNIWFSSATEHRKRDLGGCPFHMGK